MDKKIKQLSLLILLVVILVLPYFVFADSALMNELEKINEDGRAGYDKNTYQWSLPVILGLLVKSFLSILGIIFIILIIYGGFTWMTAGGNESKVEKAGNIIKRAIVGLIIIAGAYGIWWFIALNFIYAD